MKTTVEMSHAEQAKQQLWTTKELLNGQAPDGVYRHQGTVDRDIRAVVVKYGCDLSCALVVTKYGTVQPLRGLDLRWVLATGETVTITFTQETE